MPQAKVNGIELHYARFGELSAPAIVLIRGLGTQMVEWSEKFLAALQHQGLQVVIFDNRDVGLSSKLANDYQLDDMAADVVGLMDALALRQAHLFGISLGGMVAQLVAAIYPDRVRCLFSVMSSSGNPQLPPMREDAQQVLTQRPVDSSAQAVIEMNANSAEFFGSPKYPESLALRRQRAQMAYERCYCPEGVARQMRAALADGSRVARLQTITAPALVIHGDSDVLIPAAAGADTAKHIANAQLQIVAGMGHNIPDGLAADIAQRVGDFVKP